MYSIDIDDEGAIIATGGADCKVRVWKNEKKLKENNLKEPLAVLSSHIQCVNCVKFSPSSLHFKGFKYLAAGSNDRSISISVGSLSDNIWKEISVLRYHTADVIDLAWSSTDLQLASCSVDNTIAIWNLSASSDSFHSRVEILNAMPVHVLLSHTSIVNGIAWDPLGMFIASQSDDQTLKIHEAYPPWNLIASIKDSFQDVRSATMFRRLSWAPDGSTVIASHAYLHPKHSAVLFDRKTWTKSLDFIGHSYPISCAKFSPCIYQLHTGSPHYCVAIGSQDATLTVWATFSPRPIFCVKSLFRQSIAEICWDKSGYSIAVVSLDGSLVNLTLYESEIGNTIPQRLWTQSLLDHGIKNMIDYADRARYRIAALNALRVNASLRNNDVLPKITLDSQNFNVELDDENVISDSLHIVASENSVDNVKETSGYSASSCKYHCALQSNYVHYEDRFNCLLSESFLTMNNEVVSILASNLCSENSSSTVVCQINSVLKWQIFLCGSVQVLSCANRCVVIVSTCGKVYFYSLHAGILLGDIFIGEKVLSIHADLVGNVLILTAAGLLSTFHIEEKPPSFHGILHIHLEDIMRMPSNPKICCAEFNEKGVPMILSTRGDIYVYDVCMESWLHLANSHSNQKSACMRNDNFSCRSVFSEINLEYSELRHSTPKDSDIHFESLRLQLENYLINCFLLKFPEIAMRKMNEYCNVLINSDEINMLNEIYVILLQGTSNKIYNLFVPPFVP